MALSYLIALRDGISKNAATMATALRDLSQAMRDTQREAGALGGVVVQVSNAVRGGAPAAQQAAGGYKLAGGAARLAAAGFTALAGAAAAAGAAIGHSLVEAAAFREQQVGRFTAVLGDATKANAAFKDSILLAEKTRFAPRAISNTFAQLMQAVGGDTAQTRETMGRLLDLVTVNGGGDEELKQALGGVRDVINKNKLMGDDLKQLMTAGVNMRVLARSIGTQFKISAKDDDELVLKVQKAISHGQIRGQASVRSILDAIKSQTGGGAAGQVAFDLGSSTISGLISNIKGGLETLFGLQDTTQWTGVIALKGLLKDVADLFSSDGKSASVITKAIQRMGDIAAPIFGMMRNDLASLVGLFKGSNEGASSMASGLQGLLYATYGTVKAFAYLGVGVVYVFSWLTRLGEGIGDVVFWMTELPGRMYEAGRAMVDGLVNGLTAGLGRLKDAIQGMGRSTVGWLKETLGIHSPSRVFATLGGYTAQGFAQGIEGGAGDVSGAVGVMSGAAVGGLRAAGAGAGSRSIGGAGISITIAPTITSAAADPSAVAAEVLPQLSIIAQDAVEQALERMALA